MFQINFSEFAKSKRLAAGLSQQECAAALGLIHRSAFLRKESGTREFSLGDVVNFAALLGVSASELLAEWENQT